MASAASCWAACCAHIARMLSDVAKLHTSSWSTPWSTVNAASSAGASSTSGGSAGASTACCAARAHASSPGSCAPTSTSASAAAACAAACCCWCAWIRARRSACQALERSAAAAACADGHSVACAPTLHPCTYCIATPVNNLCVKLLHDPTGVDHVLLPRRHGCCQAAF